MAETQTNLPQLKRGQRAYAKVFHLNGDIGLDPLTIVRREKMTHHADGSDYPGWYIVRFDDGGKLCMHVSSMSLGNMPQAA